MAKVVDLLPWDIAVKSAVEKRTASAILEREDADQVIAELTPLEAYYAVKSLGVDGASPFLAVLRAEQIAALFDLEVWHRGRLDLGDVLVWLGAFREVSVERLIAAVRAVDPELVAVLLRRRLMIARKVRDDNGDLLPDWAVEPPDELGPLVDTPDGRFIIAARTVDESDALAAEADEAGELIDEEERKGVIELVMELYKHDDMEHVAGLVRMAETDLTSDAEETALRFRDARLEDLGFPSRDRAMAVYAPGDADRLGAPRSEPPSPEVVAAAPGRAADFAGPRAAAAPSTEPGESEAAGPAYERLPAVHARHAAEGLFHAAMRAIDDPATVRRIEGELLSLANAVLVADGIEPGELERIGEVLLRVRGTIELALAHRVAPADRPEAARSRLVQWPLRTLFSAGYGLMVALASRARRLVKDEALSVSGRALGLVDDGERVVLLALTRGPRPLYAEASGTLPRAFARPEELARVTQVIEELEVWADVARHLELAPASAALGDDVEPPEALERTLGVLVGTLAAHVVLGRPPTVAAIGREALARLADVLSGPGVDAAIQRASAGIAAAAGLTGPRAAALEPRVGRAVREVAESLLPLVGHPIDPRFVGGLVRARR